MHVKVEEKSESQKRWLENLRKINELFPALMESKDRWGTIYYSTPEINGEVDEVEFRHSGFSSGDSLQAYFYKVTWY